MSFQRNDSSSRINDILSLYLKSEENQDYVSYSSRVADENKGLENHSVCKMPSLPLLSKSTDMDLELEQQIPSNYYLFLDKTNSQMVTRTKNFKKERDSRSFDAYRNNISSSSSITQMSFMNSNKERFAGKENLVDKKIEAFFIKQKGILNSGPKSAGNINGLKESSNSIKNISKKEYKQKALTEQVVFNGSKTGGLIGVNDELQRSKSSIQLSKSKQYLLPSCSSGKINSDNEGAIKLNSRFKDIKSNGEIFYLASSPPISDTVSTPVDKFKLLLDKEYENEEIKDDCFESIMKINNSNKASSIFIGDHTCTKESKPLLLKSKNMTPVKFEDYFKILPKIKSIGKPNKSKKARLSYLLKAKESTSSNPDSKIYLDDKMKKHLIIFYNYKEKSYKPINIKVHETNISNNPLKRKSEILSRECYSDILLFENDRDITKNDKTKLKSLMNILFLENDQKHYTAMCCSDAYAAKIEKLQTNNKLYKNDEKLIGKTANSIIISDGDNAGASALKSILFLNNNQKKGSVATVKEDLHPKPLAHMLNTEFPLDISLSNDVSKKVKMANMKNSKVIKKEIQAIEEKQFTFDCGTVINKNKSPFFKIPRQPSKKVIKKRSTKPVLRSKSGCWTCRLRKKKCTEEKEECLNCKRMKVPCDYNSTKPEYMQTTESKKSKLLEIKQISIASKRKSSKTSL